MGDKISHLINFNNTIIDPLSNSNYIYAISYDNNYFQIAATLEKEDNYSYVDELVYATNSTGFLARVT